MSTKAQGNLNKVEPMQNQMLSSILGWPHNRGPICRNIHRTIVLQHGTSVTKQPLTRQPGNHTGWIFMQGHVVFKHLGVPWDKEATLTPNLY